MRAQIAQYGSQMHSLIGRFEAPEARASLWNQMLKDNEKGMVVNNTSGTLHYDDHKRMLDDVVMAAKYLPTAYDVLAPVPGVGVGVSLYETLVGYSDMNEFKAHTSMNASNRTSNQTDYAYKWVPQPIYHCDFHIPWRQAGFSYKQGDGATEASQQVALERDETLVLGNSDIMVNVNGVDAPLYGLTNHPSTLSLPGFLTDWADEGNSDTVYKEAVKLVSRLYTDRKAAQIPNSLYMYTANDIITMLQNDYASQKGDRTIMERIKAITQIRDVLPSQWLPDGSVLLVEASPQTMRIPRSTDITVVPWVRQNQMEDLKFTVFAANTLQVRTDRNGNTGILYATKA